MWAIEHSWHRQGRSRIAGIDEAGRGPLAGPVVAAAVILPGRGDGRYRRARSELAGIRDSKQLTANQRADLSKAIRHLALAYGIGTAEVEEVDRLNVLAATFLAMRRAVDSLERSFSAIAIDLVLVDGNLEITELGLPQESLVGGDGQCACIAAASILAKVHRDALMVELAKQYPEYGFERNKGYGTLEHLGALERHGPCPQHRRSFKPVALCPET